jgi:hypothetical protein
MNHWVSSINSRLCGVLSGDAPVTTRGRFETHCAAHKSDIQRLHVAEIPLGPQFLSVKIGDIALGK